MTRELIDLFVLDALANDLESLEDILRILNSDGLGWRSHHPDPFEDHEIRPALLRNIRAGFVRVAVLGLNGTELEPLDDGALPATGLDDAWFELTARGRLVHSNWDPPPSPGGKPDAD